MPELDDTQPKAPTELKEAVEPINSGHLDETGPRKAVTPPPMRPVPPAQPLEKGRFLGWLLTVGVLVISSCMCLSIILLAGFAGVRDEVEAIQTKDTRATQVDIATQYAHANRDLLDQNFEMAQIRFSAIATAMPGYLDVEHQLAQVEIVLSYTPTPTITPTPTLAPTEKIIVEATEEPSATATASPSPDPNSPEAFFTKAQIAMGMSLYEDAIEWLEALRLFDPTYRSAEVQQMLIDALTIQGYSYLRGQNMDGEDRLMEGAQYIRRAEDLGYVGELSYDAWFAEMYMSARAYIAGGATAEAYRILEELCFQSCDWGYHGVTVRSLYIQVGGTPP